MSSQRPLFSSTGAPLGKSTKTGRIIRLKDPMRSTYVIGAHGTGKSTLLLNCILYDIALGDKGVTVVDPHGDLAKSVLLRCSPAEAMRILYFAPMEQLEYILGLNPFEIDEERAYELKAGALMDVFAHTWYGGYDRAPTLQNTLETLVRTLLSAYPEHQTSFLHMLLVTRQDEVGKSWRQKLAPYVKDNPALWQNWLEWSDHRRFQDDISSSRQKIKHIIASDTLLSILCQPKSATCFRFQEVLAQKRVLLINLEGLDDESQRLLGSIILTQLLVMAKLRGEAANRVPCHIYADEFYKFSPQSFVTIINEARKYRLFCTLAHQNLEQLDREARAAAANCGNVISFRVNPEDAGILGRHFLANGHTLPAETLSNLPRFQALVRYADRKQSRQALIQTLREKGQENPAVAAAIRQRSEAYGTLATDIRQHVTDILKVQDDKKSGNGDTPLRGKPKNPDDETG